MPRADWHYSEELPNRQSCPKSRLSAPSLEGQAGINDHSHRMCQGRSLLTPRSLLFPAEWLEVEA